FTRKFFKIFMGEITLILHMLFQVVNKEELLPNTFMMAVKSMIFITTSFLGVNSRELLVYKNCTKDCKFLYEVEVPPEAPRSGVKPNHFYFVRCCNGMVCNEGGPTNIERDIPIDETVEEELPGGTVRFGESKCVLILASVIVSNTLT
uniref:UPAR/Ly6 domain-containing protein n=1 Tax=Prolemur simus TaxID=1328070 RepID=A0A8C8Z6Q6_PROSS